MLSLIVFGFTCIAKGNQAPRITRGIATHGIAVGDVESRTVVIWSRADRAATMKVTLHSQSGEKISGATGVGADDDYTGQILVEGLEPNTRHEYRVRFESSPGDKSERLFMGSRLIEGDGGSIHPTWPMSICCR